MFTSEHYIVSINLYYTDNNLRNTVRKRGNRLHSNNNVKLRNSIIYRYPYCIRLAID